MADDRLEILQKARQVLANKQVEIAREIVSKDDAFPAHWDDLYKLGLAIQSLDAAIGSEPPWNPWSDPHYEIPTG